MQTRQNQNIGAKAASTAMFWKNYNRASRSNLPIIANAFSIYSIGYNLQY
jgi:hypothetical protein